MPNVPNSSEQRGCDLRPRTLVGRGILWCQKPSTEMESACDALVTSSIQSQCPFLYFVSYFIPFFHMHLPKICCAGHTLGRQLIRESATDFHAAKPHAVNFEGNMIQKTYLSFKVRYERVISAKQHDVKPSPATLLFAPTLGTFANSSFDV